MKTPHEVKQALINTIVSMKTYDGYNVQFSRGKIWGRLNQDYLNANQDGDYPKCVVQLMEGKSQNEIGNQQSRELDFAVSVIVRTVSASVTNETDIIASVIEDFYRLFADNDTLGGSVYDAQITEFVTDNGELDPEAVVIFKVKTEQKG
jgi:hypothetical protein